MRGRCSVRDVSHIRLVETERLKDGLLTSFSLWRLGAVSSRIGWSPFSRPLVLIVNALQHLSHSCRTNCLIRILGPSEWHRRVLMYNIHDLLFRYWRCPLRRINSLICFRRMLLSLALWSTCTRNISCILLSYPFFIVTRIVKAWVEFLIVSLSIFKPRLDLSPSWLLRKTNLKWGRLKNSNSLWNLRGISWILGPLLVSCFMVRDWREFHHLSLVELRGRIIHKLLWSCLLQTLFLLRLIDLESELNIVGGRWTWWDNSEFLHICSNSLCFSYARTPSRASLSLSFTKFYWAYRSDEPSHIIRACDGISILCSRLCWHWPDLFSLSHAWNSCGILNRLWITCLHP